MTRVIILMTIAPGQSISIMEVGSMPAQSPGATRARGITSVELIFEIQIQTGHLPTSWISMGMGCQTGSSIVETVLTLTRTAPGKSTSVHAT
jgi:hypothetical protein